MVPHELVFIYKGIVVNLNFYRRLALFEANFLISIHEFE